jgi:hypothetical protein
MPEKTEFLPFHAINEFMRPDFRLTIIRETLTNQESLPEELSTELNHQIKKKVTIPGFRSSDKAPALVKVLPTSKAFEKYPDLVAVILSSWAEYQSELRDQIYQLLKSRNWKMLSESDEINIENLSANFIIDWPILPVKMNRMKLPGFYTQWPKDQDFEALYKTYTELYPAAETSIDKVSLMVVWLSLRLPYHVEQGGDESDKQ